MHSLTMMAAISPGQVFFVQVLGFIILVGVLAKFAVPVLGKILGARTQEIEETFRKIDQDTRETANRLAEMQDKLAKISQESQRRLDASLADAEKTKAQLLLEADAQVQAAFAKVKNEIRIERDKAVLELRQEVTGLTLEAAEHLVQTTMNDPIHEKIVDTYLTQLETVKKT
ncbi:MAG TPA: F0F1 ATP synthase subunit B [Planctomycetota bacterium]|nr:F0F1 ATP synthase subunit B [Planctomycetota bacterium]